MSFDGEEDFVELGESPKGPTVSFSRPTYLDYCIDTDRPMVEVYKGGRRRTMAFTSAMMVHVDEWLSNMYSFNMNVADFMLTDEFNSLAKPVVKMAAQKCYEGKLLSHEESPDYPALYDRVHNVFVGTQYNIVKSHLGIKKSDSVLEIGSASGGLSMMLARDAGEVLGVDIYKNSVDYANKKAKEIGLHNCSFVSGSYPEVPDRPFDCVVGFSVSPMNLVKRPETMPERALIGRWGSCNLGEYDREFASRIKGLSKFYDVHRRVERLPTWDKKTFVEYLVMTKL